MEEFFFFNQPKYNRDCWLPPEYPFSLLPNSVQILLGAIYLDNNNEGGRGGGGGRGRRNYIFQMPLQIAVAMLHNSGQQPAVTGRFGGKFFKRRMAALGSAFSLCPSLSECMALRLRRLARGCVLTQRSYHTSSGYQAYLTLENQNP